MERRTLLMATLNRHKLAEASSIFRASALDGAYHLANLTDLGFQGDIPEEEETLERNASSKSWFIHDLYQQDCFADDTGLEVDALNGLPGVHSARFAGTEANSANNIRMLLEKLQGQNHRRARFRTVISLILDGREYQFEGCVEGEILLAKEGNEGFGYDPVFRPDGYDGSFAAMPAGEKNRISHRYKAIEEMARFLRSR